MARYINADAFATLLEMKQRCINPSLQLVRPQFREPSQTRFDAFQEVVDALDNFPTVSTSNMGPVHHGRWLKPLDRRMKSHSRCSKCCGLTLEVYDYCPHCGAKMDLNDDGGDVGANSALIQ